MPIFIRSLFMAAALLFLGVAAPSGDVARPGDGAEEAKAEEEEQKLTPEDIPVPILRAEVGDWVLYKTSEGGTLRITVDEKWGDDEDATLVLRLAHTPPKKKRPRVDTETVEVRENIAELRALGPNDFVVPGEILVRNRKVKAVIVNYVEDEQVVRQSYFSDDIPVHGLVRGVEIEGNKRKNSLSLNDYGFADQEE